MTNKRISDIVAGLGNSPFEELMRQANDSPTRKLLEEYRKTLDFGTLTGLPKSATVGRLDTYRSSETLKAMEAIRESALLGSRFSELQSSIGLPQKNLFNDPGWTRLQDEMSGIRQKLFEATSGGVLGRAIKTAYSDFLALASASSGITDTYARLAEKISFHRDPAFQSMSEKLGALTRANQWASVLGDLSSPSFAGLYSSQLEAAKLNEIRDAALAISHSASASAQLRVSLGLGGGFPENFKQPD